MFSLKLHFCFAAENVLSNCSEILPTKKIQQCVRFGTTLQMCKNVNYKLIQHVVCLTGLNSENISTVETVFVSYITFCDEKVPFRASQPTVGTLLYFFADSAVCLCSDSNQFIVNDPEPFLGCVPLCSSPLCHFLSN